MFAQFDPNICEIQHGVADVHSVQNADAVGSDII
jgi:hypothetical protein